MSCDDPNCHCRFGTVWYYTQWTRLVIRETARWDEEERKQKPA